MKPYTMKLTGNDGTCFAVGNTEQELVCQYNQTAATGDVPRLSVDDLDNPEWIIKKGVFDDQGECVDIDWGDFENYLIDIADGSSNKNSIGDRESDKEYFSRLADECGDKILTDELSIWYDNGRYRE